MTELQKEKVMEEIKRREGCERKREVNEGKKKEWERKKNDGYR